MAVLQQIHLCAFRRCLCKTHAKADEAHGFSRAVEGLRKQRAKILQRRCKPGALGGGACEIVELQFYENLRDVAR